jgi:thiol-disulfide isomerase/thioredoxin
VGQPAPNFQLLDLSGETVDLNAFRNGRPALVTFWGVACGPCCREAPHLTELHKQHPDDLAILAVNAYDESQEVVSKFVKKEGLTHPIVLQGGKVAKDLYHVAAYPTTFWIGSDGVVVDYELDFDSAAALARHVAELQGKK